MAWRFKSSHRHWEISSAVEHLVYTEIVTSSILVSPMHIVIPNYITDVECDDLIDYWKDHKKWHYTYNSNQTKCLSLHRNSDIDSLTSKVINTCASLENRRISLNHHAIIKWPKYSSMLPHRDKQDRYSAVLYLNDNFKGGETCLDEHGKVVEIAPVKGSLLVFSNAKHLHWVNEVRKSSRYVVSFWFVDEIRKN